MIRREAGAVGEAAAGADSEGPSVLPRDGTARALFAAGTAFLVFAHVFGSLAGIDARELWLDEAFSFHIATQPGWLVAARAERSCYG